MATSLMLCSSVYRSTSIVVVYIVMHRDYSPRASTATATQMLANLTQMGVVPFPSREGCRVDEYLDSPVDGRCLHNVAGFCRTRYLSP